MSQRLDKWRGKSPMPGNRKKKRSVASSNSLEHHPQFKRELKIAKSRRKKRNNKEIRRVCVLSNGNYYKKIDNGYHDIPM